MADSFGYEISIYGDSSMGHNISVILAIPPVILFITIFTYAINCKNNPYNLYGKNGFLKVIQTFASDMAMSR
jgi:hypothetical protein